MKSQFRHLCLLLLLVPAISFGQGNKTLKKNLVASQTTHEYFLEEGKREPVVEKIEAYDAEGNLIEQKVFNKLGEVKSWEAFSYDENDNVTEEKIMDAKGNVVERITYTYKDKLIQEKQYFDSRNRMYKKKTYSYTYREAN